MHPTHVNYINNRDESAPEVVSIPSIFAMDPLIRLKRKRLDPTLDLNSGRRELAEARAQEAEKGVRKMPVEHWAKEGEEVFYPWKKSSALKRKQLAPGSSSAPKRAKVFCKISSAFSYNSMI